MAARLVGVGMADVDLDDLEDAAHAAIDGPWERRGERVITGPINEAQKPTHPKIRVAPCTTPGGKNLAARTAAYIAAADPDTVLALVDRIRELEDQRHAHMCRMNHPEIHHSESTEDERCPLCIVMAERDAARETIQRIKTLLEHPHVHVHGARGAAREALAGVDADEED